MPVCKPAAEKPCKLSKNKKKKLKKKMKKQQQKQEGLAAEELPQDKETNDLTLGLKALDGKFSS